MSARKRVKRTFATSVLMCVLATAANAADRSMNVIELFTSQGCSSCPSADALLKEYVDRPDVIALSFNVDYWDYLGWKDTLSKPAYSKRQRAYAKARGDGKVYTPQIVANGVTHAVGSDRPAVELAINKSADRISGSNVDLILETDESNFVIKIGAAANKPKQPATIYMAAVSPSVSVKINRGENTGREVTYHNVVRSMIPVGMWSGEETTIRLRRQDVMSNGGDRCAVLVQFAPAGPIVAANWMPE